MNSTVFVLLACLEVKYIDSKRIINWAQEILESCPAPEQVFFDLINCTNATDMELVLVGWLRSNGDVFNEDYVQLLLGFAYMSYLDKKMTLNEFLEKILDLLDAYELIDTDVATIGLELQNKVLLKNMAPYYHPLINQYMIHAKVELLAISDRWKITL